MLQTLRIENIAVIRDAEVEFDPGFTVLTGETGAGKSMLIDGISMLLGARTSRDLLRTGADRACVTAVFTDLGEDTVRQLADLDAAPDEDGSLFLSRSMTSDGRSQTKVNGHSVPVAVGRQIGRLLVDIHGQNDNQKLLDRDAHLSFLDAYAGDGELLRAYAADYAAMAETARQIKQLLKENDDREFRLAKLQAENDEIDAAKLRAGEEEQLNELRTKLVSLERITKQTGLVYRALCQNEKGVTASYLVDRASGALAALDGIMPDADALAARLESIRYELEDIGERAHAYTADCEEDPAEQLNRIEERLERITRLERKYGATIPEIIDRRSRNAAQLEELARAEDRMEELRGTFSAQRAAALAAADRLTKAREAAGRRIEQEILSTLQYLDMPNIRFSAKLRRSCHENGQIQLTKDGQDQMEFLIATNPGEPLRPLVQIASGGELARIMLALKSVLTDHAGTGTVIYDEIDTGISGSTSQKIGVKMRELSRGTQVICVTHSAQIASSADRHCLIRKTETEGRAETTVSVLGEEERVREIARIIGGLDVTEKTLAAARELLSAGRTAASGAF